MAAAVKYRPGRYLLAVLVALIGLYLGVFLGPSPTPALGLDLRGGTQVTLTAQPLQGGKVTKSGLDQAVNIITDRVDALGVAGASISTQGSKNIVVSVPGKGHDQVVKQVGQTALLRFRQVLEIGAYKATALSTTTPSASPSAKASPKSGKPASKKTPKAKKSSGTTSQGDAVTPALLKTTGVKTTGSKAKASSSPSPSSSPAATGSPSAAATATPSPSASALPVDTSGPSVGSSGVTDQPLPNSESPTLSSAFTKAFDNWDCSKHPNPTNGNDVPSDYIIACDDPSIQTSAKYLLAPAAVEGTDVSTAAAGLDPTGVNWVVNIQFNSSGASKWLAITKKTYAVNNGQPSQAGTCTPPTGCNAIGITLDGQVESAPYTETNGIPGGQSQISGTFSQSQATNLADILKYGALPLKFTQSDVQSVSATLGSRQLHGGLIAGSIGLALVILFSLIYYRALGFVTVGSLAVSGLILYAVTTLLGHSSVGYTLSLPGIAGFIVAVGITADSFVVYFERLRDEIREGRRLRSAVERAWPKARRTIISADFVSLLAAVVLYAVSIGDVRGFAFTLGMSTLSDLFIVWFFTRPLLTILGRRPAFDSGKAWTGIGRPRAGIVTESDPDGAPARRRPRTGEVSG